MFSLNVIKFRLIIPDLSLRASKMKYFLSQSIDWINVISQVLHVQLYSVLPTIYLYVSNTACRFE